jgi:histidinol-phosphate aminotransferase
VNARRRSAPGVTDRPPAHLTRRAWLRTAAAGLALSVAPRLAQAQQAAPAAVGAGPRINLAGNENPFGPSPTVLQTIVREARNSCRYPWREELALRDEIAAAEGVPSDHILLGNGGDEILSFAGAQFGHPGAEIVASRPTYLQCLDYAERRGATVRWIDCTASCHHDLAAMAAAVGESTSLVYVCNPDTPTGTLHEPAPLAAFCRAVAPRATVLLDEVYLDLLDDFRSRTLVPLIRDDTLPVIVVRSFSKLHALAGHRIGYAVAAPATVAALERHRMSSLNWIGVAAARASLRDRQFPLVSRRRIREGRERFCSLLDKLGLRYVPSCGNFVFHHTGVPIREFQDLMRARGFYVGRPFPPFEDWCRISIGTEAEMAAYATAMREVFGRAG